MRKAVFFDRDGIVNIRLVDDYVKSPDEFVFIDAFFELFKLVKEKDFLAILVTNQQGIGKGLMTETQLDIVHTHMTFTLLKETGYSFDGIYYCPDLASSGSKRRKPEPGMFEEAVDEFNIDTKHSWTIGDSKSDVKAGKAIGTKTIIVGLHKKDENTDYVLPSIADTVDFFKNI